MASAPIEVTLSAEDYLAAELQAEVKHEFDNGYVVSMVGASRAHNLIALTVASEIKQHLKGKPCRCYTSDMKVRIKTRGNDLYSTVTLIFGQQLPIKKARHKAGQATGEESW